MALYISLSNNFSLKMKRNINCVDKNDENTNKAKRLKAYENILLSNRLSKKKKATKLLKVTNLSEVKIKTDWSYFNNLAFNYDPEICFQNITILKIGEMDIKCTYCGAVRFKREAKSICCANGKVKLEDFQEPPKYLKELLNGEHEYSNHFMTNIRSYNNAFSFTSFGTTVKTKALTGFKPVFKIQGKVYHLIGSLLPNEDEKPKFAQIYFLDDKNERTNIRSSSNDILKPIILKELELIIEKYSYTQVQFSTGDHRS